MAHRGIPYEGDMAAASADAVTSPSPMSARDAGLLAGVRMIATLGHSCGLVDPYGYGPNGDYSPILAILQRLGEVSPWLTETWEYRQAIKRATGTR